MGESDASPLPMPPPRSRGHSISRVQPVTPTFKAAHPDLWRAGCGGVAFIRVVGRGLWSDEGMNVSQWQAHNGEASERGGGS